MKSILKYIWVIILFSGLSSQEQNIKFKHISIIQGLSQNTVHCIFQDKEGFLWFGTNDGLNKYYGYGFKIYRHQPQDTNSLSDYEVNAILEDSKQNFWIGTDKGLNKLNKLNDQFFNYQHNPEDPNSISCNDINVLLEDKSGVLWIGTNGGGLNRYDEKNEKFIHYKYDKDNSQSICSNIILSICEDKSGNIWIGTDNGLNKLKRTDEIFIRYYNQDENPNSLSGNEVHTIFEDRFGVLWAGTNGGGLNKFIETDSEFVCYRHDPNNNHTISSDKIRTIYEDRSGILWIGTYDGLNIFDRNSERFINFRSDSENPSSISDNEILSIYEDDSGLLWIGTNMGGLNIYDRESVKFSHFKHDPENSNSLSSNNILSIYEDRNKIVWIGTDNSGLNRYNPENNTFIHFQNEPNNKNSLCSNKIRAILEDRYGFLWVGTEDCGLTKFDRKNNKFTCYKNDINNPNSISNNEIWTIYEDRSGNLWIGTNGGLNKYNRRYERFIQYKHNPNNPFSISNNRVRSIYEDKSGILWIGTDGGGLNQFVPGTETFNCFKYNPKNPNSLSIDRIWHICEDRFGNLWIGTNGGGLNKFDKSRDLFYHYTMKNGLPSDEIYGILEDHQDNLWISTSNGLSKFDLRIESFRNYDENNGLQSMKFNAGAFFRGSNGEMYFGGINGLNRFNPLYLSTNTYIPPIVITDFKVFGESIVTNNDSQKKHNFNEKNEITLSYNEKIFRIEFSSLHYSSPEKNQYAYMLKGIDEDWNYVNTQFFAAYKNIPPGKYTFYVKGSNNDGVWNEKGTSIKITVKPPFWQSIWFRIAAALLISLSIYQLYRFRIKYIEKNRKELRRLVAEKTLALEKARDELEVKVNERTKELIKANEDLKREINERKKSEEERIKLQEQLLQSQKMESIGRLAGGIAHDFNNILAGIMGYAELLQRRFDDSTKEGRALEVIVSSSKKASNLTKQLLGFARHGKYNPIPIKINDRIKETIKVLEKIFEKNIKVIYDLSENINYIEADENQIDQVLTNIIINAKDAMPNGGRLTFNTENIYLDTEYTNKFLDLKQGNYVKITVTDTGIGMEKEIKDRIFEPFYTTKEKGKGTGLGLSMVYGIVKSHNGQINCYSEYGKGTSFSIYFPASEKRNGYIKKESIIKKGQGTIMVIDDEENLRNLLKEQLEELGYKVIIAADGIEAIEIYEKKKNDINLILLDMIMPNLDGRETFYRLKKMNPDIKVLLLSGFSQNDKAVDIINEGALGFFQKPLELYKLSEAVYNVLKN